MKKANGIITNGTWNKKLSRLNEKSRYDKPASGKLSWNPSFESLRKEKDIQSKKPATARYVSEFHPLSYLFTVVQGNLEDDCDKDGNPRLPTAIPGVLNRRLGREFNAKIIKLNREIDDIQKRIDGMHEKVNSLNKERCSSDNLANHGRNFGNEIYLLVRNVGMWMRRMETKAQLIERIEWSIYILQALQEIDENCNATMFWAYASWRKVQHTIGADGASSDWDQDLGNNEPKYDKTSCNTPEIIRLFQTYEAAYRRNIEISKLIKDDLVRTGSDEKLSRFLDDNYTRCKGCRALFSRRYDDLFGTRIHCPSKIKARANLLTRGTTGEEDGSHLIVCFFCTDCFDVFNPSIIKKLKRDKELKIEKDLEVLIRDHQEEQDNKNTMGNNNGSNGKSNKKRKKKKKKKGKKNNAATSSTTVSTNGASKRRGSSSSLTNDMSAEEQHSDTEQEVDDEVGLTLSASYDESKKSEVDLDERDSGDIIESSPRNSSDLFDVDANSDGIDAEGDSSMNDMWVEFLLKTRSIIELNAFMDKTLGKEVNFAFGSPSLA